MSQKPNNNLHDATTAVADFLDVLLQEATLTPEKQKPPARPARILLMPDTVLEPAEVPEQTALSRTEPQIAAQPETIADEHDEANLEPGAMDAQQSASAPLQAAPDRYRYPLQCLMFAVGTHQLSMPLIDLGSVLPLPRRLTQLPATPDWFLGILQHHDDRVKVVDTARILHIPEDEKDRSEPHLLVFGDKGWAISCDRLGIVTQLEQDDVQWSSPQAKGFALGTIRESLAILLDPEKLLAYLNRQIS